MTHYYDSKESPLKHWKGSRCQIKKVPFLNWSILGQGHQLVAPGACASASTSYPWNEGISATPVPSPTNIKRQVGSVAHHPTSTPLPSYVHSKESFRCKHSKRRGDKCEKRYREWWKVFQKAFRASVAQEGPGESGDCGGDCPLFRLHLLS